MKLSLVHGNRHRRGKERLGSRPDLKESLRIDRFPAAYTANSPSLAVDQLVARNNPVATPGMSKAFMPFTT